MELYSITSIHFNARKHIRSNRTGKVLCGKYVRFRVLGNLTSKQAAMYATCRNCLKKLDTIKE